MLTTNKENLTDLTLEITEGCRHSCTGCTVERDDNRFPTEEEFEKLIWFVKDLTKNGLHPSNLTLGPTDILTSRNREECLTHPKMKVLCSLIDKLTLNCAFLSPKVEDYDWLIDRVNSLIPGGLVKLTIPFEVSHVNNPTYIDTIRKRVEYFEKGLKNITLTRVYTVINFESSINRDKMSGEYLTESILGKLHSIDIHPKNHIDYVLPFGRLDLKDTSVRERFIESVNEFNRIMQRIQLMSDKQGGLVYDINDVQGVEGKDWDFIFRNGSLYMTPFINEAFVSFDDYFKVIGEWSYDQVYTHEEGNLIRQLNYAPKTQGCQKCEFVNHCIARGVLSIMEIANVTECITVLPVLKDHFNWDTVKVR